MRIRISLIFALLLNLLSNTTDGQNKAALDTNSNLNGDLIEKYEQDIEDLRQIKTKDSLERSELLKQIDLLKSSDKLEKEKLLKQLNSLEQKDLQLTISKKQQIDSLKSKAMGYPVVGASMDTLFYIYFKIGANSISQRASMISEKIEMLYDDDFYNADSIKVIEIDNNFDIVYKDLILMSISNNDALWFEKDKRQLALEYADLIKSSISQAKTENSLLKILQRIGIVGLILLVAYFILWAIRRGFNKLLAIIEANKERWLKDLSHKDYTFISKDQEMGIIVIALKFTRWLSYIFLFYITLPIVFSIFPFSENWADTLFSLLWNPFKNIAKSVWDYIPNLFSILVIVFVMKYFLRFVKYIFTEIETNKLKINGFHADWAMPTFSITKFLLYAFTLVLIFPHLPGSDSNIFKGVSVFVGILFSLGSSSAIANMVAGLVITYMRPFKIGDRIKIGDISGDVIEKNLLVTRIRTIKNEVITIPNSSVLNGNTVNYSSEAQDRGLIIHSTITIGYDVKWQDIHQTLIDAALATEYILKDPLPFVLQTSLDDFYVSYQINAYTKDVNRQAVIYSQLHQNIQDLCAKNGIEILSPHYKAARDGNMSTIPREYLPSDYKPSTFNINITDKEKTQ